jgi:hypothetical protein
MRLLSLVSILIGIAFFNVDTHAAIISFGAPQNIATPADVSTLGTLIQATNFSTTQTVNGVTFVKSTQTPSASYSIGQVTVAGIGDMNATAFTSGSGGFNSLNATYKAMLVGAAFGLSGATANGSLTLTDLTIGNEYLVQLWVTDPRTNSSQVQLRTQSIVSGGSPVSLDFNVTNAAGGVGQYVIGTFVADSTSQVISLSATQANANSPAVNQFNAIQLREIATVPEPSTFVLSGVGCFAALYFAARKKQSNSQ